MNERVQELKQKIAAFQKKHALAPFELIETDNYRLQINPVAPLTKIEDIQNQFDLEFPAEYTLFVAEIGNGLKSKFSSLLPLSESMKGSYWDVRASFPYTEAWTPEYEGPALNDSAETLGKEEYERQQNWMMWWGDKCHTNGTLLIEDMGCGYSRHLVLNGPQRGTIWEDLRAADEGIIPATLHGKPTTFLDFYENEIRYNLRGLDHEL